MLTTQQRPYNTTEISPKTPYNFYSYILSKGHSKLHAASRKVAQKYNS